MQEAKQKRMEVLNVASDNAWARSLTQMLYNIIKFVPYIEANKKLDEE
jgi:hypothetical protein